METNNSSIKNPFGDIDICTKLFKTKTNLGIVDLGVNAEIKLSEKIDLNLFALNGEGYKNVQDDNGFIKIGGNLIYVFNNGLSAKIYYDSQSSVDNFNLLLIQDIL